MRVLLVEDDTTLSSQLARDLAKAGYAIDTVDNGADAEFMGNEEPYDLVVLDLGLPKRSGLEVLQNWRKQGNKVPVVILTARDAWHEKVDGFKAGADDYLTKPFHIEELMARMQAVMRRQKGQASAQLQTSGLVLDEERQVVSTGDGQEFELTGTEFRLLRYMMLNPGRILSKSILTEHVYDYNSDKDSNVIEVYINRLRQKLGKELIETRRGQGYVFGAGTK
ncbi:MAG: response regulator transcription factor [Gammaproteobacteria bacterium]|nr:response regulator transcription factor [Gammaproteobacteria bacterium]